MPDWSYHILFKPILSRLPTHISRELVHRGMNTISSIPLGDKLIHFLGREESPEIVGRELNHNFYPNPVGISGKLDPLLSGTKAFTNLGFGFIEIGPVTLDPSELWEAPVINQKDQLIAFPPNGGSIGLTETIRKLSTLKRKQPLHIRLAGTSQDVIEMIKRLECVADVFIIEHDSSLDYKLILSNSQTNVPIYLAVQRNDVSSFPITIIQNLFSGIVLDEGDGNKRTRQELINNISYLRDEGYTNSIITIGGISEPIHALDILDAGADLVMVSGGYVFAGPGLPKRIIEAMQKELAPQTTIQNGWIWYFLFGLSIIFGGMIALFFSLSSVILPYDEYFLRTSRELLILFNERILLFMAHDRMTLAGTMISGGIVYTLLALFGVRIGLRWTKQAIDIAAIIGFLGIFLFIGYGYFDWLHLLFWLILLPLYFTGYKKTKGLKGTPTSSNLTSHRVWKYGLFGQLSFVLLGFSFVVGGIVISIIGITTVFVPTDLLYLCMPEDTLQSFNERLIPLIAHDRAGFGGALLSVGFLVLTVSLWGFQQGNKWVWWTLLIGGIPAFICGIYVHFAIGYTTFIHLLPAYIALILYFVGLFFHIVTFT